MKHDPKDCRILVVDDEKNIVSAVERELRHLGGERYRCTIEGFSDPLQALERARVQPFDLVISDYRMPALDGLGLLRAMAELQPDCARVVLSGQTERDTLIRMINETHIYRFIGKPWSEAVLRAAVMQALEYAGTIAEHRRLAAMLPSDEDFVLPETGDPEVELVLVVDDDPGVLASLSRVLTQRSRMDGLFAAIRADLPRRVRAAFDEHRISVQVSPSPAYALRMAGSVQFACVIADLGTPEMDGIEMLRQFAQLQPDCIRVLISARASSEELTRALASAKIFSFVDKPWTDFDLKCSIALALAHRRVLMENRRLAERIAGTA